MTQPKVFGGDSKSKPHIQSHEKKIFGGIPVSSSQRAALSKKDNIQAEQHRSLRRTESADRPPRTPSPVVKDISSFITSISKGPFSLNGHFGDLYEGWHIKAGRVALKRPRIVMGGNNEDIIRVRSPITIADSIQTDSMSELYRGSRGKLKHGVVYAIPIF